MTSTYLEEWKIQWDKRHDDDPYCEECLDSFPLGKLNDLEGYKVCDACLPEARIDFASLGQWLSEQDAP